MKGKKVLVTGGDGMLGSNLVRELLSREYDVSVLVQKGRETGTLDGLNISRIEGDLLDASSMEHATKGQDYIIHVAASTSVWPSRSEMVYKVNIEGTRNVMEAAKANNVSRVIHVGTANTFGFGTKENPGVEGTPYAGTKYGLGYMDSKYQAHQLVLDYVKKGLDVVIVNPTFMMGPFDSAPSSGAMIVALYKGKVPGYSPGGRNYVCAKDAATAVANAIEKGRTGESYILGNENLTYKEAFAKIASVIGKKPPSMYMPKPLILGYGRWSNFMSRVTGKQPKVTLPMARIACDFHYFSSQKAVKELDMPQTPIEEGIRECFDWLKENGYLK